LTAEQELAVQLYIRSRPPIANTTGQTLWNRASAHDLVQETSGEDLPDRTFSAYLKRWDMIPPKPLHRAHALRPAAIKQWMAVSYPVIATQAREARAELLWLDIHRMAILDPKAPELNANDHMVFLTDSRGHLEWSILAGQPTPEDLIDFMGRAIGKSERHIHVIVREPFRVEGPVFTQWSLAHEHVFMVIALPTGEAAAQHRSALIKTG
jgi:hypothetical protein